MSRGFVVACTGVCPHPRLAAKVKPRSLPPWPYTCPTASSHLGAAAAAAHLFLWSHRGTGPYSSSSWACRCATSNRFFPSFDKFLISSAFDLQVRV